MREYMTLRGRAEWRRTQRVVKWPTAWTNAVQRTHAGRRMILGASTTVQLARLVLSQCERPVAP